MCQISVLTHWWDPLGSAVPCLSLLSSILSCYPAAAVGNVWDMCLPRSELLKSLVWHNCFSLEIHTSFCTEATSSHSKLWWEIVSPSLLHWQGSIMWLDKVCTSTVFLPWFLLAGFSQPASSSRLQISQVSGLLLLWDCPGSSPAGWAVNSLSKGPLPSWFVQLNCVWATKGALLE